MASIRRKKHKWQAVIRRAGQPTISKSLISKTDARKWALGIEQKLDQGACGVKDRSAFNLFGGGSNSNFINKSQLFSYLK